MISIAIINGIISFLLFTLYFLTLPAGMEKATDLSMVILYLATLLNSYYFYYFVYSLLFFVKNTSFAIDSTCFFPNSYTLYLFLILLQNLRLLIILSNSNNSGHSCLVQYRPKNTFCISLLI